jgi:nicotinamidase-related amidase
MMQRTIDPRTSALLVLHWQNELVKPGGVVSAVFPAVLAAAGTIQRMQEALEASREHGVLVMYVNAIHRKGYPELPPEPAPLAAGLVRMNAFIRGTWGAEVIDELKPLEDEIEISNYATSAFLYNELDLILRNRRITTVVLAGLATNWIVESTARDAFNRGYSVWTLADCCNSPSKEAHDYCVTNTLPLLGVVCGAAEYGEALSAGAERSGY